MKASAASRCASSELNSFSKPSSVDLRVYMPQRTGGGTTTAVSDMVASLGGSSAWREAEESESVPARAGHLRRNGTERTVVPALILEAVGEHLHGDGAAPILALQ